MRHFFSSSFLKELFFPLSFSPHAHSYASLLSNGDVLGANYFPIFLPPLRRTVGLRPDFPFPRRGQVLKEN